MDLAKYYTIPKEDKERFRKRHMTDPPHRHARGKKEPSKDKEKYYSSPKSSSREYQSAKPPRKRSLSNKNAIHTPSISTQNDQTQLKSSSDNKKESNDGSNTSPENIGNQYPWNRVVSVLSSRANRQQTTEKENTTTLKTFSQKLSSRFSQRIHRRNKSVDDADDSISKQSTEDVPQTKSEDTLDETAITKKKSRHRSWGNSKPDKRIAPDDKGKVIQKSELKGSRNKLKGNNEESRDENLEDDWVIMDNAVDSEKPEENTTPSKSRVQFFLDSVKTKLGSIGEFLGKKKPEPRAVRFPMTEESTSDQEPEIIMATIKRLLQQNSIKYAMSSPFCAKCQSKDISFEIEICQPFLHLSGVRFARLSGSAWQYKVICKQLLTELNLKADNTKEKYNRHDDF